MDFQLFLDYLRESMQPNTDLNLPVSKGNPLEIEFEKIKGNVETVYDGKGTSLVFANSDVYQANILSWRRLTALDNACKDVYEVTFDIEGSNFTFKAGDTIGIIPQNVESDVCAVLKHLELMEQADCRYKITVDTKQKGARLQPHIPRESTLRHVLTHCVNLRCVIKKLHLLELSRHTNDEKERKILEYFCSKDGSSAYQKHILDQNFSLLELFATFRSCKPPIQVLLAHLPRLFPRPYSVVNTGLKAKDVLKICFSVVQKGNNKKGLVTSWLERMILNKEYSFETGFSNLSITNGCDKVYNVPIYLRENKHGFRLPENMETPLVLIGPGTGIAPFIGFLLERQLYKDKNPDIKPGEVWLFFGCRNPDLDFIYEKELNEFVDKGVLNKLCTAFSRVENGKMRYIQDSLKQNSIEICRLIQSNASIFVCGDLNHMAVQIEHSITQCLVDSGNTLEKSVEIIRNMKMEKRYVVDAWS